MSMGRTKNKYIKNVLEYRVREFGCIITGFTNVADIVAHHIHGGRSLDFDGLNIGKYTFIPLHKSMHQHSGKGIHDNIALSEFEKKHDGTEKEWCLETHYRYIDVYGEPLCPPEYLTAIERYCNGEKSTAHFQEIL